MTSDKEDTAIAVTDAMTPAEEAETVRTHRPFVFKLARRWPHLELDDAAQIASEALVRACRLWRRSGGANIRTYANMRVFWRLRLAHKLERRQSADVSLDDPIPGVGGEDLTILDMIGTAATQEDALEASEAGAILRRAVAALPPKERRVITMRFFEERTLEEVGDVFGVSRERVRQIQVKALAMLRMRLEDRGLR